jgi:hypothetical protein
MTTPAKKEVKKPTEDIFSASSIFPAPNCLEIKLPDPCPKRKPMAWIMAIKENTTPTAAVDCVFIFPTKKVSAIL